MKRRRSLYPVVINCDDENKGIAEEFSVRFAGGLHSSRDRVSGRAVSSQHCPLSDIVRLDDTLHDFDSSQELFVVERTNQERQNDPNHESSLLDALEDLEERYSSSPHEDIEESHMSQVPTQEDSDSLLAWALQQEEEDYAVALGQDRERREEERRQLQQEGDDYTATLGQDRERREEKRRQLVTRLLNTSPPQRPAEDEANVVHYEAPDTLEGAGDQSDFTLVIECNSCASEKDELCAICFDSLSSYGPVVSLRNCNHNFHLDCIDDALAHSKRCPKCRKDIRSEQKGTSPSGTMNISRPVIDRLADINGSQYKRAIQIEYVIPDGFQKHYHELPDEPFKGTIKVAYLPNTSQGNCLLNRLIYAFSHGLTFRIARAESNKKSIVNWATIPHKFSSGEGEFDDHYKASCNEALDQLGVPAKIS
jgi:deltex-like protein